MALQGVETGTGKCTGWNVKEGVGKAWAGQKLGPEASDAWATRTKNSPRRIGNSDNTKSELIAFWVHAPLKMGAA